MMRLTEVVFWEKGIVPRVTQTCYILISENGKKLHQVAYSARSGEILHNGVLNEPVAPQTANVTS